MAGSNFVTYVEIPWVKDHFIVCEFRSLERKQTKFLFGSIAAFTHFVKSEFVFPTFVNFTNLNIFPSRPARDRFILFLDFTNLNIFPSRPGRDRWGNASRRFAGALSTVLTGTMATRSEI